MHDVCVGTTPPIDTLLAISTYNQITALTPNRIEQVVLEARGILGFIDDHVAEFAGDGPFLNGVKRKPLQIIKIK